MSEAATAPPAMTPDVMVAKFIALRDKVATMKKKHTDELAPYNVAMATLEAMLIDVLNRNGVESMRAPAGTFYTTTRTSAKVENFTDVLQYIKDNDAWELLESRVAKSAVEAIIADTGSNIPGVVVSRELVLNVRRG